MVYETIEQAVAALTPEWSVYRRGRKVIAVRQHLHGLTVSLLAGSEGQRHWTPVPEFRIGGEVVAMSA